MNVGTYEHWADGNMTKSKFFNYQGDNCDSNKIELYVPITAFQDS